MTKLMEWFAVLTVLFTIWLSLITGKIDSALVKQYPTLIFYSPIIFVGLFGIYAAMIILYRVLTFNNCEKAAAELQQDIQEARSELSRLGFQFKSTEA